MKQNYSLFKNKKVTKSLLKYLICARLLSGLKLSYDRYSSEQQLTLKYSWNNKFFYTILTLINKEYFISVIIW